jgi:aspartyl-tRNA(Asn)/glutamyl-tRNA(Gln) amidotransferase subunit A
LSVAELLALYRRKELSPVEMVRAVLEQIDRHNSVVNAYCWVDREAALRAASESEARWRAGAPRGLIDGVPVGIKDNVLVAGMPARFGSKLTSDAPVPHDAPAVARLREQGAIIVGKTTMPEFGWKAVTDSPLTGVTRNPWDTRKTPGGSSGGAVAAVVLGMGNIHVGTDGGGSIRIPAAFTGCYGIKPTRARVPAWPPSPLGTLAHVGALTRSVADAALALTIIAHPDIRDVYAWTSPAPDFRTGLEDGVRGLRIAYSPRLGYAKRIDPEVEPTLMKAIRRLTATRSRPGIRCGGLRSRRFCSPMASGFATRPSRRLSLPRRRDSRHRSPTISARSSSARSCILRVPGSSNAMTCC